MMLIVPDKYVKFRGPCDPRLNRSGAIRPKAVGSGIFDSLSRDNCRRKVASDIISGVAIEEVGRDVRVKSSDSRSNCSRDVRVAQFLIDDDARRRR